MLVNCSTTAAEQKSPSSSQIYSTPVIIMLEMSGLASETVLNVGVISFGLSGRIFHAPFLLTNPKFKLVAVYERTKAESQDFATKHGIAVEVVRSVDELVNRTDLHLIVVCSPIEFHFEHAKVALLAGKHVLVEKAFTSTSQQAKELFEIAAERELVCAPYQNRRFDSDFLTLQRVVGKLGRIAEYNGIYNRYSPNVRATWKDQVVGSGGNFLSLGSHMIDQAVVLFGTPDRVFGDVRAQRAGGVLDDAWEVHLYYNDANSSTAPDAHGLHTGGFRAILKGSLLAKDHGLRYMVHGDHGSWMKVGVDTQEEALMQGTLPSYPPDVPASGELLTEFPVGSESSTHEVTYGSEPRNQWGVLTTSSPEHPTSSTIVLTPPVTGSYHLLYEELHARIVHGVKPVVDPTVSVTVLRIIELARQSSREGRVLDYTQE